MRLVMFYQIEGDKRLFCEWKKIIKEEAKGRLRIVIDFVRSLSGWENCVFLGFERDAPEPDSPFEAYFKQGVSDVRRGAIRKRMTVRFYIVHQEETTTRKEFYEAIDAILKDAPYLIRKFIKNFVKDPEVTDWEIDELMNLLLEKNFSEIDVLVH